MAAREFYHALKEDKTEEQNVKDIKRDISKAEWRAKVEQLTQS